MKRFLAVAAWLTLTSPAFAQNWQTPTPSSMMDVAADRVRAYVASIPNMPKDVLVIPAAGDIAWPGVAPADNVRAEVWLVVPRDNPQARPLMMFAVRPATGEVYAMFLQNLQKTPRYR